MTSTIVHIELRRAAPIADPLAVAGDGAWYQLRIDGGAARAVSIPWSKGWHQDLANLRRREHIGAALRRLGAQLARMLEDAGWIAARSKLRQARREGTFTSVIFESDAAELFRLPWELLPVDSKSTPLQAVLDAPIRYAWLGAPVRPGAGEVEGGALLSGTGPERLMGAQLTALRAIAAGSGWLVPDQDLLINATLSQLMEVAEERRADRPVTLLHLMARAGGSEERPVLGLGSDRPGAAWVDHTAEELAQLTGRLSPTLQLAVLSVYERNAHDEGCSSHGLLGLRLHLAGVPAVICPRWPLSPEGMTRFTEVFHRGLLREARSAEDALLNAFRTLAREGRPGDAAALQLFVAPKQPNVRPYRQRPYPGLGPYGAAQAANFAGRGQDRDAILAAMQRLDLEGHPRFLTVVGAAHTGKSSLVAAGVVPALLSQGGDPGWCTTTLRPGDQPLAELDRALARERPKGGRLLVVVDQLEEIFAVSTDRGAARQFVNRLWALATEPEGEAMVLCTLRVDALSRCAAIHLEQSNQQFDAVLYDERFRVFLREPGPQQLQEIVAKPMQAVGYTYQDDLAVRLVFDAGSTPGALPRLSLLLDRLWSGAPQGQLSRAAAGKLGGVAGVVAVHAETTWAGLEPRRAQPLARALLLGLIDRDPAQPSRRRRAPLSGLLPADPTERAELEQVVAALLSAGLLRRSEPVGGPAVEISTELLIDEWPRLRQWLNGPSDRREPPAPLPATAAPAVPRLSAIGGAVRGRAGLWAAVAVLTTVVIGLLVWINRAPPPAPPTSASDLPVDDATAMASLLRQIRPVDRPATWVGEANRLLQSQLATVNLDHGGLPVDDAFFASDGQTLATVSDGLLRLFAVPSADASVVIRPPAADGGVVAATFIPNGLELVTVARSGAVHRWSRDGTEVTPLRPANADGASPVASFSPDGGHLILAEKKRWVVLSITGEEVASGTIPTLKDGSADPAAAVAVSNEARNWVVGTEGGRLHLHRPGDADAETLTLENLDGLLINGSGSALVALGEGTMRIVDMRRSSGSQRTPKQVRVHAAAFSTDGDHVVIDFYDADHDEYRARVAKVSDRQDQRSTPALPGPASALAFQASPERLYRGTPEGEVAEIDLGRGRVRRTFKGHRGAVQRITIDPRGRYLATAGSGGLVRLWSLQQTGEAMIHLAPLPLEGSRPQVISPTGEAIAGIDPDGQLWTASLSGSPGARSRGRAPSGVLQLAVVPWADQTRALALTESHVYVWDEVEWRAPLPGRALALGPSGERVAVAIDGAVAIVRARPGETVEELRVAIEDTASAVAFDTQGQWLAVGGAAGAVQIFDSRTGRLHRELTLQDQAVAQLCVSGDGEAVAGAALSGPVSVWTAEDGRREAADLKVGDLRACAFQPNGTGLSLADQEGTLVVDFTTLQPLFRAPGPAPTLGVVSGYDPVSGQAVVLDREGHVRRWLLSSPELSRRLWASTSVCEAPPGPNEQLDRCACAACLGEQPERCAAIANEADAMARNGGWCPRASE